MSHSGTNGGMKQVVNNRYVCELCCVYCLLVIESMSPTRSECSEQWWTVLDCYLVNVIISHIPSAHLAVPLLVAVSSSPLSAVVTPSSSPVGGTRRRLAPQSCSCHPIWYNIHFHCPMTCGHILYQWGTGHMGDVEMFSHYWHHFQLSIMPTSH